MEKLLLALLACVISSQSFGQITLQSSFPYPLLYHANFKNAGQKLVYVDYPNNQILIYNFDQSLFKTIDVPSIPNNTNGYYVEYLSEELFDTDSSTFEYIVVGSEAVNNVYLPHTYIIDEPGTILFARDTLVPNYVSSGITTAAESDFPVFTADSITYLRLSSVGSMLGVHHTELYTLPGKLFGGCCCDQNFFETGENEYNKPANDFLVGSYPNPSQSYTKVFYNLPDKISHATLNFYDLHGNEVKRFVVSSLFQYILVSTDNLPSGTYLYRIETSEGISEGKEQIVIR